MHGDRRCRAKRPSDKRGRTIVRNQLAIRIVPDHNLIDNDDGANWRDENPKQVQPIQKKAPDACDRGNSAKDSENNGHRPHFLSDDPAPANRAVVKTMRTNRAQVYEYEYQRDDRENSVMAG